MTAPDKPMAWMVEAAAFLVARDRQQLTVDEVAAIIADHARRAASAGKGWVTVTDDPATWPGGCGPVVCVEDDHNWCHVRSTGHMRRQCGIGAFRGWRWMPWPSAAPTPAPPSAEDEWAAWNCWCGAKGSGEKDYRRHKDNVHQSAATPEDRTWRRVLDKESVADIVAARSPTPPAAEPARPEAEDMDRATRIVEEDWDENDYLLSAQRGFRAMKARLDHLESREAARSREPSGDAEAVHAAAMELWQMGAEMIGSDSCLASDSIEAVLRKHWPSRAAERAGGGESRCHACGGRGRNPQPFIDAPCSACHGTGRIECAGGGVAGDALAAARAISKYALVRRSHSPPMGMRKKGERRKTWRTVLPDEMAEVIAAALAARSGEGGR